MKSTFVPKKRLPVVVIDRAIPFLEEVLTPHVKLVPLVGSEITADDVREADALVEGARGAASRAIEAFGPIDSSEWNHLKNDVRESVQKYIYDTIKRNPMILPIIVEI